LRPVVAASLPDCDPSSVAGGEASLVVGGGLTAPSGETVVGGAPSATSS
jgi:hypothetical protein